MVQIIARVTNGASCIRLSVTCSAMRNLAHTNSRVRYAEGIAVAYEQRETGFALIAFAGEIIAATTVQRAQFAIKIISQVVPLRALPAVRPGKC